MGRRECSRRRDRRARIGSGTDYSRCIMGTGMADLWADEHFDFADALNQEIWRESPARGARLATANAHVSAGGWQDRWATPPLPWVPDIVGRRWRERGGVLVIGSAYAPFVVGIAGRRAAMPLSSYAGATSAAEFAPRFLSSVVRPDATYYRGIRELVDGLVEPDRLVLTDLCRASFVEQRDGKFHSGDDVVQRYSREFDQWVDAGADWTLRRISESGARVLVLVGDLSWTTFQRVIRSLGGTFTEDGWCDFAQAHPATRAGEFVVDDVKRPAIRVAHPTWRNKNDASYTRARRALEILLDARSVSPTLPRDTRTLERTPTLTASRPAPDPGGRRVVGLHFVCRGALNVRDLPDGTFETGVWVVADQHARTAEYVALHESKSGRSYRQGRILSFRRVVHEGRRRLVFQVAPDPKRLAWTGNGTGEKGYRYL